MRGYRCDDADTIVVALGSVLGTIEDVIDDLRDEGERIGALAIRCFRPYPARRGARGTGLGLTSDRGGEGVRRRHRRHRRPERAPRAEGTPTRVHDVVAGLGGRPITKASLRGLFGRALEDDLGQLTFLDMDWGLVERELERMRASGRTGPHAENILRDIGIVAARSRLMPYEQIKFFQTGTFVAGNRLLDAEQRSVQATPGARTPSTKGHRACQGCGEALGARYALDAAMRATDGQVIAANATGCLEVFSTPFPETSWQIPWIHSLFGNAPAVATGIAAAMKVKGRDDMRVVGQGGDGGTLDIGFGCLSGMFERNDDVLYICYDNEAYMNTGVQRSGATPPAARTMTTQSVGDEPGNVFGQGKFAPLIAMAHEIPYVATATVADLRDLEYKVERAMQMRGARYLHVLVTCPLGWGCDSGKSIEVARAGEGDRAVSRVRGGGQRGDRRVEDPAAEARRGLSLAPAALRHLFKPARRDDVIARIQARADRNVDGSGSW